MHIFRLIAASVLLLANRGSAGTVDPDVVQADLVFPRAGATYKPVYPFPIVFAVTNARLAWPYTFKVFYKLVTLPDSNLLAYDGVWRNNPSGIDNSPRNASAPEDKWIASFEAPKLVNITKTTQFRLSIYFSIEGQCARLPTPPPNGTVEQYFSTVIDLTLSTNGTIPNITAAGPCGALPLGAIAIQAVPNIGMGTCPFLGRASPQIEAQVQNCSIEINDAVQNKVAADMMRIAGCTSGTWPNITGMVGPCPTQESSGASVRFSMWLVVMNWIGLYFIINLLTPI